MADILQIQKKRVPPVLYKLIDPSNPKSQEEWVKQAGGTGYDRGYGTAVDSFGNSYVAGFFTNTASFDSFIDDLLKDHPVKLAIQRHLLDHRSAVAFEPAVVIVEWRLRRFAQKRVEHAAWEQVPSTSAEYATAQRLLGYNYFAHDKHDYVEAKRHVDIALAARPDDPKVLEDAGRVYILTGLSAEGTAMLKKADTPIARDFLARRQGT